MANIIGVRFKRPGKIYFFDPDGKKIERGSFVIVETSMGKEFGEVAVANRTIPDEKLEKPLKKIIRVATAKDKKQHEENKQKEKDALKICEEKVKEHGLDMTLIDVEYKFDRSKLLFFFTAEGRIDFRDLVKDLAAIFKTRIELRQVGVRDEVKRLRRKWNVWQRIMLLLLLRKFRSSISKNGKRTKHIFKSVKNIWKLW